MNADHDRPRVTDVSARALASRAGPRATGSMATFWGWLVAAVSLVVAMGLGGYTVLLDDRLRSLDRRLAGADAQLAQSRAQVADARRALASAESSVAVLIAPDLVRIDLAGQGAARNASARAYWSRAAGIVIVAENLPAPPPDRTYQLWVVTPSPVSVGLFAPDPSGRVTARFDPPAGAQTPTALAVTLETRGGATGAMGESYLAGAVK